MTATETLRAIGHAGSWFARVEADRWPCVWDAWKDGNHYHDPNVEPDKGHWPNFLKAIRNGGIVILTHKRANEWRRDGYIALYRVTNVRIGAHTLDFDFVEPPIAKLC